MVTFLLVGYPAWDKTSRTKKVVQDTQISGVLGSRKSYRRGKGQPDGQEAPPCDALAVVRLRFSWVMELAKEKVAGRRGPSIGAGENQEGATLLEEPVSCYH